MALTRSQQRTFILVSGVLFLSSMAVSTINLFNSATSQPLPSPVTSAEQTLDAQERGYELVLQREPNNVVALEGLATTRLEMNDPQGAIAPLENLVKLNPGNTEYVAQLAQARQQAGDRQ